MNDNVSVLEGFKKSLDNLMGSFAIYYGDLKLFHSEIDELDGDLLGKNITVFDENGKETDGIGIKESVALIRRRGKFVPVTARKVFDKENSEFWWYVFKKLPLHHLFSGEIYSKEACSDIRTQISAIVANSTILRTSLEKNEFNDEADLLTSSVNCCKNLLSGISNSEIIYSMFNGSDNSIPFNLSAAMDELFFAVRFYFGNKMEINTQFEKNILIKSDVEQLASVVTNIVANSYLYNISEKKHMSVKLTSDGESAVLVFEDNGVGISEESHNGFFGNKKENTPDSEGLGLTVVKLFTKLLGGNFSIISKGDCAGTVLRMSIPLYTGDAVLKSGLSAYIDNRYSNLYTTLAKSRINK